MIKNCYYCQISFETHDEQRVSCFSCKNICTAFDLIIKDMLKDYKTVPNRQSSIIKFPRPKKVVDQNRKEIDD